MKRGAVAAAALLLFACRADPVPEPESIPSAATTASVAPSGKVEIVKAGEGDVAELVKRELARAKADDKRLLVYVGATWCEPCRHFHEAAAHGKLDVAFPNLRLLEFDLDADRARLEAAGYGSPMIPLLDVPHADGTGSETRMMGSVKGAGAVDEMTPRLQALLAKPVD